MTKYSRLVPLLEQENLKLKNEVEQLNRQIQQQDDEIKRHMASVEKLIVVNNFLVEGLNRSSNEALSLQKRNKVLEAVAEAASVAWDRGTHRRDCVDECMCGMDALGGALEALDEGEEAE